jgi:cysteine-rich repeat protein
MRLKNLFFVVAVLVILGLPLVISQNTFEVNQFISLKHDSGNYLSINSDGKSMDKGLNANRNSVNGDAEKFKIRDFQGNLRSGAIVSFESLFTSNSLKYLKYGVLDPRALFNEPWIHAQAYNERGFGEPQFIQLNVKIMKDSGSGEIKCGDVVYFVDDKGNYLDIDTKEGHNPAHLGSKNRFTIYYADGSCPEVEMFECVTASDCGAGEICGVGGVCVPAPECVSNNDCGLREICVEGQCVFNQIESECADSQVILKLSATNNAHGALYNYSSYLVDVRYDEIFQDCYQGENPYVCNGENGVLKLSSNNNAHVFDSSVEDAIDVCYGDLNCRTSSTDCEEGEGLVVSLSAETNAHLSIGNNYPIKVCCSSGDVEPVVSECGDGVLNQGEECDDGNLVNGDGCSAQCEIENFCGNDVIERPNDEEFIEQCDGENLDGFSCENLARILGIPVSVACVSECADDCTADYSFTDLGTCGNDEREAGELCDGDEFYEGLKCSDFGYTGCIIELDSESSICGDNCVPDLEICLTCPENNLCGNEIIDVLEEQNYAEECDGLNLDNWTCDTFGLEFGTLRCSNQCEFDLTACSDEEPVPVEECNNNAVCEQGESCACADCHGYQAEECSGSQVCSYVTNQCGNCPQGTSFDSITKSCQPYLFSLRILKPNSNALLIDKRFAVGQLVDFEQETRNTMKNVNLTWNFGDGGVGLTVGNCLTSGDCDSNHSYTNFGHYVASVTALEQGGSNSRTNYTSLLVYKEGVNVFAIISKPKPGEVIGGDQPVSFNASQTFASRCFVDSTQCVRSGCYSVGSGLNNLTCFDFAKNSSELGVNYDFLFEWTFRKNDYVSQLNGTWSQNYSQVVDFERSFFAQGNYSAELKVTYGEKI